MDQLLDLLRSPRRREILRLLWAEERAAGEVHRAMDDVTFGAVSQHLRRLEGAGLVSCRRQGRHRYYRAVPDAVGALRPWLESMWTDALERLKQGAEELERDGKGSTPSQNES